MKALPKLGYQVIRKSRSHIRLTTQFHGEHHVTVLSHDPLRIGTLSAILSAVAAHHGMTRDAVLQRLFD